MRGWAFSNCDRRGCFPGSSRAGGENSYARWEGPSEGARDPSCAPQPRSGGDLKTRGRDAMCQLPRVGVTANEFGAACPGEGRLRESGRWLADGSAPHPRHLSPKPAWKSCLWFGSELFPAKCSALCLLSTRGGSAVAGTARRPHSISSRLRSASSAPPPSPPFPQARLEEVVVWERVVPRKVLALVAGCDFGSWFGVPSASAGRVQRHAQCGACQ